MAIYKETDYRVALRGAFEEKKAQNAALTYQKMASFCRMQSPYLSKIFSKQAHMSNDQLYLACQYLKLKDDERDFMDLLLEYSRSVLSDRKERMLQRIRKIQSDKMQIKEQLPNEAKVMPEMSGSVGYWLDPYCLITNLSLLIPEYAQDPFRLCAKLNISKERMAEVLEKMAEAGQISRKKGVWVPSMNNVFLPKASPLYRQHSILFRLASLQRSQEISLEEVEQPRLTFCADEKTYQKIRNISREFLDQVLKLINEAPNQGVYQLNFELFPWF